MKYTSLNQKSYKQSEAGFTIVEMLITMTIFLIVLSSVYGVLRIGNLSRTTINARSETITNLRQSLNSVSRETVNAGLGYTRTGGIVPNDFAKSHLGIPADGNADRDLLTSVTVGNNINLSSLSVNGVKNDVVAFASRDLYFNSGKSISIIDSTKSGNSIALQTSPNACLECKPFDLFLVESADGKQAVVMATEVPNSSSIVLGSNDPLGINQQAGGNVGSRSILNKCLVGETIACFNYAPPATAKKIFWVSYGVDSTGTLNRTSYGNNTGGTASQQIQKQPLAYGIQSFQIRYLMQDGTLTEDPSAGNTNQQASNDIVQVEFTITVRAENNQNGVTRTELINMSSTSSTRNLKYDIE